MRPMLYALALTVVSLSPVQGETRSEVRALYDAMLMEDVISIMQSEGVAYGEELRSELFPGRGGAAWPALVTRLYDKEAMHDVVIDRFDALLGDTELDPLLTFFQSDRGARIVRLELEARRAMMAKDVEDAAKERLNDMRQEGDHRLEVLGTFIAANDLIESNVVGAMNANYAFYIGLMDGGAFPQEMTEDSILNDVWAQEPDIRADTIDWVYSYLGLAYQPLSDDDIAVYSALSETEEGKALNRAIFGAFDTMYTTISQGLGQGAAQFIIGEDL
ncbi:DUF2059 domain-containing protein [Oceaniglobus ichthyenteri]|uniref:DUF2059 domain-containing protein n=1 Tax=Oceaniglobus ichthyenteri TaxID=2136177 RepID=UPI0013DE738B|nr:DUF2059 domain-containing protein [Oceaniglobus ichthyenteri]